jgi:hypothetical protein
LAPTSSSLSISLYGSSAGGGIVIAGARSQQHEHPHLLGSDFKRVHDAAWPENHASGRSFDALAADRSAQLTLKNVEGFVFPVVEVTVDDI